MVPIQHQAARKSENFPVASWLLPPKARPAILAFYDFARGADNLADDPSVPVEQRRKNLIRLQEDVRRDAAESVPGWAQPALKLARENRALLEPMQQLLVAFIRDCERHRTDNWMDLLEYCSYSAAPVGRYMLAVCGETKADMAAADALCSVLQIFNHVQDIRADYIRLNRIYLPQDWLAEAGVSEPMLAATASPPALRQVIDRLLNECSPLLVRSKHIHRTLRSRRLRMEIHTIWQLATHLQQALYRHDPLAKSVRLSRLQTGLCLWCGVAGGVRR